jgi:hypothetical protein
LFKKKKNDEIISFLFSLIAFEIFDDKRNVPTPRVKPKSSNESSISEDLPVSHKSST